MFGPLSGPRRRIGFALTVAAATAIFFLASGAASAEDGSKEAVIGTFETVRGARAADGRPATFDYAPKTAERDQPEDDEVSRLYADAMDDLEAGQPVAAQRKFEKVIASDPDGHLAKSARGFLADLYRGAIPATRAKASPPPQQPAFETPPSALGAGDIVRPSPVAAARSPLPAPEAVTNVGWDVNSGIEEEFIVEAGDRVFFGSGSAELGQRARIVLSAQARWLASHAEFTAVIEGHTDDGAVPDEQNAKLSQARAAVVRDRLIEEGIEASRLALVGMGRKEPVANCPGSDCAAQNRRVVTVLKTRSRDSSRQNRGQSLAAESARLPTQ